MSRSDKGRVHNNGACLAPVSGDVKRAMEEGHGKCVALSWVGAM